MEHVDYDAYDEMSKEEPDKRMYKIEWTWLASPDSASIRMILLNIPFGKSLVIKKSDRESPYMVASRLTSLKMSKKW